MYPWLRENERPYVMGYVNIEAHKIYPAVTDYVTEIDTLYELKIIENELKINGNLLIDLLQYGSNELTIA